jgi:ankyrin repeat protein
MTKIAVAKAAELRISKHKSKPKVSLSRLLRCPYTEFDELVKKPCNRLPGLLHALAEGEDKQIHRDVLKKLEKLLSKRTGVVLTEQNGDGETALHRLAGRCGETDWYDFKEVLRIIFRRQDGKRAMNIQDNQGRTPLFRALQADNGELAYDFLQQSPSAAAVPDHVGDYPLQVALNTQYQWVCLIEALVKAYPCATTKVDRHGNYALHTAAAKYSGEGYYRVCDEESRIEVIDVIANANPAALRARNNRGDTVVHSACKFQHYFRLIGRVAVSDWHSLPHIIGMCPPQALHSPNANGETPFHLIVSTCALSAPVEYILNAKPDAARITDNFGNLPLHCMGKDTPFTTAEQLLAAFPGAITVRNLAGEYPITKATSNGASLDVVYTLVQRCIAVASTLYI